MKKIATCKLCEKQGHWQYQCYYRPAKPKKIYKPPKRYGKKSIEYKVWRDAVAIPYLDKTYGHTCVDCGIGGALDIDHVLSRGSRPDLKQDLSNIVYRCRSCHIKKTSHGGV